ncbi:CHAT domain-containing protein [Sparassis latifolia]
MQAVADAEPAAKPLILLHFVQIFFNLYKKSQSKDDLSRAISLHYDFVNTVSKDDANWETAVHNLAKLLLNHIKQFPTASDTGKSISMLHDVLHIIPDNNPYKHQYLHAFGIFLRTRFKDHSDFADLQTAIFLHNHALQLIPAHHEDRPACLTSLGVFLCDRFDQLGDLSDLELTIKVQQEAVQLTPDGHSDKPFRMNNLGNFFQRHFEHLGKLSDLEEAIALQQEAVQLTPDGHPNKPAWLSNLGLSFLRHFERLGELSDLKKSITLQQEAVRLTPDGHPDKPFWLNNLGSFCMTQFKRLGELSDLEKAITLQQKAVQLTPDGHPDKPSRLNNLGNSILTQFERLGELSNLEEAISLQQKAVQLTPDGHPSKPFTLNNLGNSILTQFERLGELSDLEKAITLQQEAVQLTPNGHPNKPTWLSNLGLSFLRHFERLGELRDLKKSITLQQEALRLTPDSHLNKPSWLNNLGNSFKTQFERLGELSDLKKAIALQQEAVQLTPDDNPNKPSRLNNLGNSFFIQFKRLGKLSDLEKAITLQQEVVQLASDGHPNKPSWLNNLGNLFLTQFEHLDELSPSERVIIMQSAMSHYQSAAYTMGPPSVKFKSASQWAYCAQILKHPSLLEAYTVGVGLLPQVAWLGLKMEGRHHELKNAGQVIRDAAAAAIESENYNLAIEWLEQGRSVVWNQVLQLRTPVDNLSAAYPEISQQLQQLSIKLEQGSTAQARYNTDTGNALFLENAGQHYHRLVQERENLIQQIHALPGFETFLLPKTLSQLTSSICCGPVVILNASKYRCDALVIQPHSNQVLHISLDCTIKDANNMQSILDRMCKEGRIPSQRASGPSSNAPDINAIFESLLSQLWLCVVKPVLDALKILTPSPVNQLQHLWWCPTGPFAFLPIHAAGIYSDNQPGTKLSDFVISSYTPTISSLTKSAPSETPAPFHMLTVAQPNATGQSVILGTLEEVNQISKLAKGYTVLSLQESDATVTNVSEGMQLSSWAHFACHGVQNKDKPLKSALLLAGEAHLGLEEIIKLSLPHAEFAFLSACMTATGDQQLSEEAVHLAAGMLLAGYRGVIATMWSIKDATAPHVAEDVYAHLFKNKDPSIRPDSTEAAYALHNAIQNLHERLGAHKDYMTWVPYVHFGI